MATREAQRRYGRPPAAAALALALATLSLTPTAAGAGAAEVSASVTPAQASYGTSIAVSGSLSEGGQAVAAALVALQADAYPFHGFTTVARASTAADGSFAFTRLRADRNVRLRVVREEGGPGAAPPSIASAVLPVFVGPSAAVHVRSLGPGRAQLSLRLAHTTHGGSTASVNASWFVAARGTRVFRLLAVTPTRELSAGLTYASATIDPPSKRFVYRVCLNPAWEGAMGRASAHGRCPRGDYSVGHDVG
jgi:hypothetical protein